MSAIVLPEHNVDPKCALEHSVFNTHKNVTLLLTVVDFYISDHPSFHVYAHFTVTMFSFSTNQLRKYITVGKCSIDCRRALCMTCVCAIQFIEEIFIQTKRTLISNYEISLQHMLMLVSNISFISGLTKIIFLIILWSNFNAFEERNLICAHFRGASQKEW